jgi:hypothetical protein
MLLTMVRYIVLNCSFVHLDCYITCNPLARGLVIALVMEAVRTSETSVNFNLPTWRYIPEDSKLHVTE